LGDSAKSASMTESCDRIVCSIIRRIGGHSHTRDLNHRLFLREAADRRFAESLVSFSTHFIHYEFRSCLFHATEPGPQILHPVRSSNSA
jgi:hypothetical protein